MSVPRREPYVASCYRGGITPVQAPCEAEAHPFCAMADRLHYLVRIMLQVYARGETQCSKLTAVDCVEKS